MIDSDLVAKKLALIETCVQQLRTLARPEAIRTDIMRGWLRPLSAALSGSAPGQGGP